MDSELNKIVDFVSELEKLKCVHRQNKTLDDYRSENSAEHSWHVTLMAVVFQGSCLANIDLLTVIKMLLLHDVVELDAGDAFLYDEEAKARAELQERMAAKRIFALLPDKQSEECLALWEEFEERKTPEAKYAAAMDALQPLINHVITEKENENPHELTKSKITQKKRFIESVSEGIWEVARDQIDQGTNRGLYIDK